MTATTLPPAPAPAPAAHGGTALGANPDHPRHRLGNAVRAVRVFVTTAVEVVILGSDGSRRY